MSGQLKTTYAVTWQESCGHVYAGKLEVRPSGLRLEGRNGEAAIAKVVPFEELVGLRVGRNGDDRLGDRPSLVLALRRGSIKIASVAQPGILSEIAERIASLNVGRHETSIALLVPIKDGTRDLVCRLVRDGPPFDPAAVGFKAHRVFVADRAVIFLFELADDAALERLLVDTDVLAAAAAWHDVVDGPPQLAQLVYSWTRPDGDGVSFEPTPGPGDSDGGDVYAP